MIKKIKKAFLGNETEINNRLMTVFGTENLETKIKAITKRNLMNLLLILLLLLILGISLFLGKEEAEVIQVEEGTLVSIDSINGGTGYFNFEFEAVEKSEGQTEVLTGEKTIGISKEDGDKNEKDRDDKGMVDSEVERELEREVSHLVEKSQEESAKGKILLPNKIGDNVLIKWEIKEESNFFLLLAALIFSIFFLWRSRYALIRKAEREARNSVVKELPGFINKIIILLNGGMIFAEAFRKVVSDYEKYRGIGNSYFYNQLSVIKRNEGEINKPIIYLLQEFAKKIEVREFTRVVSIIKEETMAGGDVKEKLISESQMLWLLRKKDAEERSKKAETKMTFPLVILLVVMMLITISPTFMEM